MPKSQSMREKYETLANKKDAEKNPDEEEDYEEQTEWDDHHRHPSFAPCDCCKMSVHFVLAQSLPIIMFYVGLRSYLETLSAWEATHVIVKTEHEERMRNMSSWDQKNVKSLGWYLDCVQDEAIEMMEKWHVPSNPMLPYNQTCMGDPGPAHGWGLSIPVPVLFSGANYLAMLICAIFVLVLLVELLCCSRARGFGQGRYISFTYTVQSSMAYKICAGLVVVFSFLILADTLRFLCRLLWMGESGRVRNFVSYLLLSVVTVFYSAVCLLQAAAIEAPFFDYTSEDFKELQFKRGWKDVLTNNELFAKHLGVVLLQYKLGEKAPLKAICTTSVQEACNALSPEDTTS